MKKAIERTALDFEIKSSCPYRCVYCATKECDKFLEIESNEENQKSYFISKAKLNLSNSTIILPEKQNINNDNISTVINIIERLLSRNNKIEIVSKPKRDWIDKITDYFKNSKFKENLKFTFLLGSCHDDVLKLWEPDAPLFEERYYCLRWTNAMGYRTSVSIVPLLDNDIGVLLSFITPFTKEILIEKKSYSKETIIKNTNNTFDLNNLYKLEKQQNDKEILKLCNNYKKEPYILWGNKIMKIVLHS